MSSGDTGIALNFPFTVSPFDSSSRFKPVKIRVEFSKTGRLRFLSHLELMILFHRAIRRASVPIEYSKGFHPAPNISFGPPLSVGVAGLSEYFDMEVRPPFDLIMYMRKLNELLPEGVFIKDMRAVPARGDSLNSFIRRYEFEIKGGDVSNIAGFLSEKEILVKREKSAINIRSMVEEAKQTDDDTMQLLLIDQGEIKVRLGELLPIICNEPVNNLDITRTALYGWNGGWVRPIERSVQWIAKY
jgi:radical SAM-linked protein